MQSVNNTEDMLQFVGTLSHLLTDSYLPGIFAKISRYIVFSFQIVSVK